MPRPAIEALVFDGLREELAQPETITEYLKVYNAERRRRARVNGDRSAKLNRRDAEIGRELDRLIDAVTQGVDLKTIVPRIKALETERDQVRAALEQAQAADQLITLHPAALDRYAADINRLADLEAAHAELPEAGELIETVRRLVQQVIVHAPPNSTELKVEIKARLSELTGLPMFSVSSQGGDRT